jgi:2-dehydropantoate 2-reductase
VLPLQNGVDSVDELGAAIGAEHVLGGATQIGARIADPGMVERFSPFCQIVLGEPGGGVSERAERIAGALREVGVDASASPDIQVALWEKFMLLAPLASLTSAANVMSGQIRAVPETASLWNQMMREVSAVGQAFDVAITDATAQNVQRFFAGLPDTHTTSMQRDFEAKRKVELEYLTGAVVRRGDEVGVETPRFDVVYAVLKARALSFGGI